MRKQYWFFFMAAALVAGCAHTGRSNKDSSAQHFNKTFVFFSNAENSDQNNFQQNRRSQAIARLKQDSQIQLYTEGLGRIEGRFLISRDDTLFLLATQKEMRIPIDSIDELRVRGRATKTGAIAGGVVVGLVGFGLGVTVAGYCGVNVEPGDPDDTCNPVAILSMFTLGGAAVGGLLGAAIGTAVPKWHVPYSSSRGR